MRTPYIYARRVTDAEYVQRVRVCSPQTLVPMVAAASAKYLMPEDWMKSPYLKSTPWALADIARVSLSFGNAFRRKAAEDDLLRCCAAYSSLSDPEFGTREVSIETFSRFMLRLASEQLGHYESAHHAFGRSIALYGEVGDREDLQVIHGDWASSLLGSASIEEYVAAGFLLQVSAAVNGGVFAPSWLDQDNFKEICRELPAGTIREVIKKQFIAEYDAYKIAQRPDISGYRRFTHNPLQARPVVSGLY